MLFEIWDAKEGMHINQSKNIKLNPKIDIMAVNSDLISGLVFRQISVSSLTSFKDLLRLLYDNQATS